MNFEIKYNPIEGSSIKRWSIETPLEEKFQIINQLDNCYELYDMDKNERLTKLSKFEDCLKWIREYTKYDW